MTDLSIGAIELLRYCNARAVRNGEGWMQWQMPSVAMQQLYSAGLVELAPAKKVIGPGYPITRKWRLTQLGEAYLKMIG